MCKETMSDGVWVLESTDAANFVNVSLKFPYMPCRLAFLLIPFALLVPDHHGIVGHFVEQIEGLPSRHERAISFSFRFEFVWGPFLDLNFRLLRSRAFCLLASCMHRNVEVRARASLPALWSPDFVILHVLQPDSHTI